MQFSRTSAYLAGIFITTALLCGSIHHLASTYMGTRSVFNEPLFLVPLGWFSGAFAFVLSLVSMLGWIVERVRAHRLDQE